MGCAASGFDGKHSEVELQDFAPIARQSWRRHLELEKLADGTLQVICAKCRHNVFQRCSGASDPYVVCQQCFRCTGSKSKVAGIPKADWQKAARLRDSLKLTAKRSPRADPQEEQRHVKSRKMRTSCDSSLALSDSVSRATRSTCTTSTISDEMNSTLAMPPIHATDKDDVTGVNSFAHLDPDDPFGMDEAWSVHESYSMESQHISPLHVSRKQPSASIPSCQASGTSSCLRRSGTNSSISTIGSQSSYSTGSTASCESARSWDSFSTLVKTAESARAVRKEPNDEQQHLRERRAALSQEFAADIRQWRKDMALEHEIGKRKRESRAWDELLLSARSGGHDTHSVLRRRRRHTIGTWSPVPESSEDQGPNVSPAEVVRKRIRSTTC